jgi:HJR/Mrr/RecB family endonuclease
MGLFKSDSETDDYQNLDDFPEQVSWTYSGHGTPAEELASSSVGNVSKEKINNMDIKNSLQSHLLPNEIPHYILEHPSKGLKFEHPELDEKIVPHNSGYRGGRYLLATNKRLLFIAGWPEDAGTMDADTVIQFPYINITNLNYSSGGLFSKPNIQFDFNKNLNIAFFTNADSTQLRNTVEYVESKENGLRGDFENEVNQIRSDIADINSLISESKIEEAEKKIEQVEENIQSVREYISHNEFSDIRSDVITQKQQLDNIKSSIKDSLHSKTYEKEQGQRVEKNKPTQSPTKSEETKKEDKKQNQEHKQKVQKKVDEIRSGFYEIESLISEAEFQQARQTLDNIQSQIISTKKRASQKNLDTFEKELKRLDQKCENQLSKSHVLTQLREMDPYEFEELVAKIWRKQGWDAQVTSGSTDRGVDVVATKEDAFETRRHLIQVKRHGENTKVGSEDIQRYAGLYARRDETPDAVFVVTSNQFTKEAEEVAKSRGVRLVDCDELYNRLAER